MGRGNLAASLYRMGRFGASGRKRALDRRAGGRDDGAMEKLEEKLAHLERLTDELSDVVARQADEIATLRRRVEMLMSREAEREADAGSHIFTGQEKPPHY